ncbi:MAG: FAD-binding oxidoreductase [Nannocystaceae bacterium]|nr:FAD-binding oxidoreductase [Nannocystaceae bacterium]
MDDEKTAEERMNDSGFIQKYVEEHRAELEALRAKATAIGFAGKWFIIGDSEYPDKRLQYATTSVEEQCVSPRIILYAAQGAGVDDIKKAVALCRDTNMALAIRTGGHQYCGYSSTRPENMQIDLSETFPEYDYDSGTNVLRCGVSHALGDWAKQNNETGVYLPMGVCAHVNLGGHVHTGGWGMVARSHGLLADHVAAFNIIVASGEEHRIVRPVGGQTSTFNDDLYFAALGGGKGGDFGIVTHWEFNPMRDADYPNSACYAFTWLWSKDKMEAAVAQMQRFSKKCASGEIPSDYEFMCNITGLGMMNVLPEKVKEELAKLGVIGKELSEEVPVPPLIQLWMCFTNKGGASETFDDQWFEAFASKEVCGTPIVAIRDRQTPVSEGLAEHFIMLQPREMEYPFVKRFRSTMDVKAEFPAVFTERMHEIMGLIGTADRQHLVSQQQIYAGGAVAENGKAGLTAYSWRDQALALSHDSFYDVGWLWGNAHNKAEQWQKDNDEAFIGKEAFADADMRLFAFTFGDRVLDEVWQHYYDSEEKYQRVRRIKAAVDPDGIFSPDSFSVSPA